MKGNEIVLGKSFARGLNRLLSPDENKDSFTNPDTGEFNRDSGTATQLQLEAVYRF